MRTLLTILPLVSLFLFHSNNSDNLNTSRVLPCRGSWHSGEEEQNSAPKKPGWEMALVLCSATMRQGLQPDEAFALLVLS